MLLVACAEPESQQSVTVLTDPDAGEGEVPDADAPLMVTDDGPLVTNDGVCRIRSSIVDAHRTCQVDADCEVLAYRPKCCEHREIVGIATEGSQALYECAQHPAPLCDCGANPSRADDGRVSTDPDLADVEVHCVAGQCRSSIGPRPCGASLECEADEVCVAYENGPGGGSTPKTGNNALFTYDCKRNPCKDRLDCSCAASLCELASGEPRECAVEFSTEVDVSCNRQRD